MQSRTRRWTGGFGFSLFIFTFRGYASTSVEVCKFLGEWWMLGGGPQWIFFAFFRAQLFPPLLFVCVLFSLRTPDGQQFSVAGRKHKRLHKVQPIDVEPVSHDLPAVLLAEVAEILRVDQLPAESVGSDDPALQPSLVNPFLHFICPYVQCFG
jgi:hypothetical protein